MTAMLSEISSDHIAGGIWHVTTKHVLMLEDVAILYATPRASHPMPFVCVRHDPSKGADAFSAAVGQAILAREQCTSAAARCKKPANCPDTSTEPR